MLFQRRTFADQILRFIKDQKIGDEYGWNVGIIRKLIRIKNIEAVQSANIYFSAFALRKAE